MDRIIKVRNLVKRFGNFNAVDKVSFDVNKGELFGFLGINGAGKSTTINMLCTLYKKTEGEAEICGLRLGYDNDEIRKKIGVVFQENSLDDFLTVKENLVMRGYLYEESKMKINKQLHNVVESLNIEHLLNKRFKDLSGGQKRICDIGRALMNTPEILFLDEPTTGIDPKTRKNLWNSIEEIQKINNVTIFLTTHYMEEASKADNICIIDKGKIAAQGTPFEIKDKYSKNKLKIQYENKDKIERILKDKNIIFTEEENRLCIEVKNTIDTIEILNSIKENIRTFEVLQGTIEDAFINITGMSINKQSF
ncbi:MAG: ATP-binding cassette domain-containing protein [Clostridium sp.]